MALTKVETKYGTVVGKAVGQDQAEFLSVPFAKPPVGELRFAAPQEPDPWEGELACVEQPPAPIQHARRGMKDSEDCLYLNVFTSAHSDTDRLPVMVWIFGGGFQNGSCSDQEFDGTYLSSQGVVLVAINYRCGVMGFFSNKELEDRLGYVGNVGILDQILALKWVQANIAAFGGDPDNVTIFGQSAGGISTRIHLTNELSQGLFHKAIVESGGGLNEADLMRPKAEYQSVCDELIAQQGWSADDLMTLDAQEISDKLSDAAKAYFEGKEVGFFQPFIDGVVMKEVPGVALAEGKYADVPIICGTVSGDSWMFSRKVLPDLLKEGNTSYYRGFAISPHQAWAQTEVKQGRKSPFYCYYFTRVQPAGASSMHQAHFGGDTPHSTEISYVFGTLDFRSAFTGKKYGEEEYEVSKIMSAYWTSFAKTGDPNGEGRPQWPAYTSEEPVGLYFSNDGIQAENLVYDADEQRVLDFVQSHPGMTVSLEGF